MTRAVPAFLCFTALIFATGIGRAANGNSQSAARPPAPISGVELQYTDDSVRAQDDFYQHVNGKWLSVAKIPADKSRYGAFDKLRDDTLDRLHLIVEHLQKKIDDSDPDQRKIADLYASFMDEAAAEKLDLKPLQGEFARIVALTDKQQIPALIAHLNRIGVSVPYESDVSQDAKDPRNYAFVLNQSGLGLPDRDYYLLDDAKFKLARQQYLLHIEKMFSFTGDENAWQSAQDVLTLETELAQMQWTNVQNRDPVRTYNKIELVKLATLGADYDWNAYLAESGAQGKINYLLIEQPDYIAGLTKLLTRVPLSVWKTYFCWHLLSDYSSFLSKRFVDEDFIFNGTALRGTPKNTARWKRGVDLVNQAIGESLGRMYVAQYFPPASKDRMDQLVKNLLAAYQADIATLDWMSPETKLKAQAKLAKLVPKIGYPRVWRDYSALTITKNDLVGNVLRASSFDYERNLAKLGKPIDRDEWTTTPQTVNAFYRVKLNEVVFPAGILQPPFFNPAADDAVNYGGIGAVIGHEISHGFDDSGSQYDGDGNLVGKPGWFTQSDLDKFRAKTHALVEQYAAEEPVPGFHVNGELTLGENIADNSGLAIAYKAYELSLGGKKSPVIDGLTGEQRLYIGYAQIWRGKSRTDDTILRIKTDPHSPQEVRGTLPLKNQPGFYQAFGVNEGDKMYLPPAARVLLW
jgi:putative endopeptidase